MTDTCYICPSDKFVDDHHLDCLRGQLSPETVPLCRRCHVTYHTWGVGAFSPDTTEKALEVENKRREILRLLPSDHLQRHRAASLDELEPLKLEDVKRSGYWYRKWGIKRPKRERESGQRMPFKMPNSPPLCGKDWLTEHLADHTPEEIAALAIEVACDDRWPEPVTLVDKRGTLKKILRGAPQ